MLEVLDPEQNKNFRDHYLDLPFDLSKTLFICTANTLDTIPAPLLDRMDVIQLSGYTEDEKFGIAKRYLVPKQIEAHGLGDDQVTITDKALRLIIREYTREAGVRNLERRLADVLARLPGRSQRANSARRSCASTRSVYAPHSDRVATRARYASAPPSRASQRVSLSPRSAATSSSSRRLPIPARAG